MKKKMIKKLFMSSVGIISSIAVLSGCGSSGNAGSASGSGAGAVTESENVTISAGEGPSAEGEVTTIIIGTGGSPKPWLWVDEDGRVSGYDAEVIYAIDELLPQYELKFEVTEFASLFTGVDTGRYTMAVNNFNWREDRAEKYLF